MAIFRTLPSPESSDSVYLLKGHDTNYDDDPMELIIKKKKDRVWGGLTLFPRFLPRRIRSLKKHHLMQDDVQDTTALLSEDEHSLMHSLGMPQEDQNSTDKVDIVWPETLALAHLHQEESRSSSHNKRTVLHKWKSRMGRSMYRVRQLRPRFVTESRREDEEEVTFDTTQSGNGSRAVLDPDQVGLYAYPHDAVEAVYRDGQFQATTWDELCVPDFQHDLMEVDPVTDPLLPEPKQSFVVSYDEWDCAQLVLQNDDSKENEEKETDEESLFLHLPSSSDDEGVEVKYNSAFHRGFLQGDDSSSDEEDILLNSPPSQGFQVIRDSRNDILHPAFSSDDPALDLLSLASSCSDGSPLILNDGKRKPLGAQFAHPGHLQLQLQLQSSSSNEKSERPLGIMSGHPSWVSNSKRGGSLAEASQVWKQVCSPEMDGNVTDPPSPTKIETCETHWSQGIGWSTSDDDSDLTVSDVGFTESLTCMYGGPRPIASFLMKPRKEKGPLTNDCPSDEDEENMEPRLNNKRRSSVFACKPDVMEDLVRSSFYHADTENKSRDRPQCSCIKCSVTSMYANLGI